MNPLSERAAAWILTKLVRGIARGQRLRVFGSEHLAELAEQPAIFVHWHHQILLAPRFLLRVLMAPGREVAVIASWSRDGALGARVARALGLRLERGSSSRGGDAALRRLHRQIKSHGASVLLAVDGPRGPAQRSKPGALVLAQIGRVPIVPLAFAARTARRIQSWDRMWVPWPLTPTVATVGAPILVPQVLSAQARVRLGEDLDRTLDRLTEEAVARLQSC